MNFSFEFIELHAFCLTFHLFARKAFVRAAVLKHQNHPTRQTAFVLLFVRWGATICQKIMLFTQHCHAPSLWLVLMAQQRVNEGRTSKWPLLENFSPIRVGSDLQEALSGKSWWARWMTEDCQKTGMNYKLTSDSEI